MTNTEIVRDFVMRWAVNKHDEYVACSYTADDEVQAIMAAADIRATVKHSDWKVYRRGNKIFAKRKDWMG